MNLMVLVVDAGPRQPLLGEHLGRHLEQLCARALGVPGALGLHCIDHDAERSARFRDWSGDPNVCTV